MNNLPRVTMFNCVSTAYEMLRFSTDAILNNAGYDNFDYVVVKWLTSPEVDEYLEELNKRDNVHIIEHVTDNSVGFVPNLRGMMNDGFNYGFQLNDYCGLVNTDMYFGKDWLLNLVKYCSEDSIVNSTHITPIKGKHVITANLNIPEYATFNMDKFNEMYNQYFEDVLKTEDELGGWLNTNTMPYLIPKKFWQKAGPWELEIKGLPNPPDRRFFQRCKNAGAYFTMSKSSIVYHHEAVERRGKRPKGAEHMRNE